MSDNKRTRIPRRGPWRRRRRWVAGAAGLLALLTLVACTSTITGQAKPAATSGAGGSQLSDRTPISTPGQSAAADSAGYTEVYPGIVANTVQLDSVQKAAELRRIDPCALHDVAAAAQSTGMTPSSIMPTPKLSSCTLDVSPKDNPLDEYALIINVGTLFSPKVEAQEKTQHGGVDFFRINSPIGDSSQSCTYVKKFSERFGIDLTVSAHTSSKTKDTCQIGAAYLDAVAKYWVKPATRADHISTPVLSIAEFDPCAALSTPAKSLGRKVTPLVSEPFTCSLLPTEIVPGEKLIASGLVQLSVHLKSENRDGDNAPKDYKVTSVTVAGHKARQREFTDHHGSQKCELAVQIDTDKVALTADATSQAVRPDVQTFTASSPDCARSTQALESALALLG
ncbi:hypothetical protein [Actinokineospora iranica]|uniref:DUF3558 domain-containing protein n=1 Tax=Actinokineospora iranica TaxID=1271860 RepID=A0A1G6VSR1_9PSEU|nr:hypothetical protein [Actinokineospora iranica]SDD56618.1 hypothetical protein SAMN05216174_11376 [Actinokineospora iranica]